jgi:hypothetical protein
MFRQIIMAGSLLLSVSLNANAFNAEIGPRLSDVQGVADQIDIVFWLYAETCG